MNKNNYKQLYEYCQALPTPISRADIKNKAVEIANIGNVRVVWVKFDHKEARGLFVQVRPDVPSEFLAKAGAPNVILLDDGLKANKCWQRFIVVKEVMHLFDEDDEKTAEANSIQELLTGLEASDYRSGNKQLESDARAVWMALACLCPEAKRQEFKQKKLEGLIDDYAIASQLRIPQAHIRKLLSDSFDTFLREVL